MTFEQLETEVARLADELRPKMARAAVKLSGLSTFALRDTIRRRAHSKLIKGLGGGRVVDDIHMADRATIVTQGLQAPFHRVPLLLSRTAEQIAREVATCSTT